MKLAWDQVGKRQYETGVDQGVLYLANESGVYDEAHAWNGLTTVTESPSGAESNKQYADNQVYVNLLSAELFGATVEAFTYPDAFAECDGSAVVAGVSVGQQGRRSFGLSYRTRVGNDVDGTDHGYKIHLVYGALAAPSEKAYGTINDSPEAITFSWELSTTPVPVGVVGGKEFKPTASLTIDSTKTAPSAMAALEELLYGTSGADASLPLPGAVLALVGGTVTEVETVTPTYVSGTHTITIPTVAGVVYKIDGEVVSGSVVITEDTEVTAEPAAGYSFTDHSDNDWSFDF